MSDRNNLFPVRSNSLSRRWCYCVSVQRTERDVTVYLSKGLPEFKAFYTFVADAVGTLCMFLRAFPGCGACVIPDSKCLGVHSSPTETSPQPHGREFVYK